MKTIQEAFAWRAAVKEYNKDEVLSEGEVMSLLDVVRMAPSAYGLQPYKLMLIENKDMREKLRAASYGQAQVTDASHFVVFVSKINESDKDVDDFVDAIIAKRGVTKEILASYEGMMKGFLSSLSDEGKKAWAAKQAYLGLGTLISAAAISGIDASPMEGFNPAEYDAMLSLTEKGYTASVICALGKRIENENYAALPKVRKEMTDFVERV